MYATTLPNFRHRDGLVVSPRLPNGLHPVGDMRRGGRAVVTQHTEVDYGDALTTAAEIQAALDSRGSVVLRAGQIEITEPIILRSGQRLRGSGYGTQLNYTGSGDYAVIFGESGTANADCSLRDLIISDAGIHVVATSSSCDITRVWTFGAPYAGIFLDVSNASFAGGMSLVNVVLWSGLNYGLVLHAWRSLDGLVLDNVVAQTNARYGVWFETYDAAVVVSNVTMSFATIQSNASSDYPQQVRVSGAFEDCRFDNVFCELNRQGYSVTNFYFGSKTIDGVKCRPTGLRIGLGTYSNLNTGGGHRHALFEGALDTTIEQWFISGDPSANIYWKDDDDIESSSSLVENQAFKPVVQNSVLLPANRVVEL